VAVEVDPPTVANAASWSSSCSTSWSSSSSTDEVEAGCTVLGWLAGQPLLVLLVAGSGEGSSSVAGGE
jgi:hypothetical protein